MLAAMSHRGPDDSGLEILGGGELVLGHLRLSILDLSPLGHQPMSTPDRKSWIVFNGEIYNFREVRKDLEAHGWQFRSTSDTEMILFAYRQWGLAGIERFHGMFAFALWDAETDTLHLCRDRFGVKPLYYSVTDGRLAFSSESKGLNVADLTSRQVDPASVAEFVRYGYISSPRSIFSDVQTVSPGTVISFQRGLNKREWQYWVPEDLFQSSQAARWRKELAGLPEEELLDRAEATLQRAFEYRMVADVPVGLFLSGGIDSSLVATLLTRRSGYKLRTFTIGYGASEFDETAYARQVAETLGADHSEFIVSPDTALGLVDEISEIADEPMGDSSLIPTLMVSRVARQHVKVALSADGADELFGGYARYSYCGRYLAQLRLAKAFNRLSAEILDQLPASWIANAYAASRAGGPKFAAINDKLRKFVRMSRAGSVFEAYDATVSEWSNIETERLLGRPLSGSVGSAEVFQKVSGLDHHDQFMYFDMTRYLPGDLLAKVDRASMAVSLEAREPFLDHEMAGFAAALPIGWKVRGAQNKYILRRILSRYFPASLFDRPKQGFSAPIGDWLRGPLREQLLSELCPSRVREFGILDADAAQHAVNALLSRSRGASPAGIWMLFQLQQWAGRWLRPQSNQATTTNLAERNAVGGSGF